MAVCGAALDDAGDGAQVDRFGTNHWGGPGAHAPRQAHPDAAHDEAFGDASDLLLAAPARTEG